MDTLGQKLLVYVVQFISLNLIFTVELGPSELSFKSSVAEVSD